MKGDPYPISILLEMPHVVDAFKDSDGYWVQYKEGITSCRTGARCDHEDTPADILRAAREAGKNI